jgi:hypothetical protein
MDSSKKIKKQSLDCAAESLFINIPACRFKILSLPLTYNRVEHNIITDLHKFDLLDNISFKKHDVKKIFYHYIIRSICDLVANNQDTSKVIIQFHHDDIDLCNMTEYSSKYQFISFINTIIRKICNLLPIIMYTDTINSVTTSISSPGSRRELIYTLTSLVDKYNKYNFTFSKAKNFIKNYELMYLDRELFGKLRSLNLLI